MMTNELRKLIKEKIESVDYKVYYQLADNKAMYPHVIFNLESISSLDNDINRLDYRLIVDIFNKNDVFVIENITDSIIKELNALNCPQDKILPTFYFESRRSVIDEDKQINHRQLIFVVQLYERK